MVACAQGNRFGIHRHDLPSVHSPVRLYAFNNTTAAWVQSMWELRSERDVGVSTFGVSRRMQQQGESDVGVLVSETDSVK